MEKIPCKIKVHINEKRFISLKLMIFFILEIRRKKKSINSAPLPIKSSKMSHLSKTA